MENLENNTEFDIRNGKLMLDCASRIEIPLIQILFVNFESDAKNPLMTIKLMSGTEITMRVNPKAKQKIKDLINDGRAEIIALELKKK